MKTITATLTALAVIVFGATAAGAQYEPNTDLGSYPTVPGAECTLTTANNVSVHNGNALVVTNGPETFTVPGVEDVHDESTSVVFTANTDFVSVNVTLGPDDPDPDTSVKLSVTCTEPPPPTTTTTVVPPTTTPPPPTTVTTPPPPTTTPPPPPVTTCVDTGTCHPRTGGSDNTPIGVGLLLAGVTLAAVAVPLKARS